MAEEGENMKQKRETKSNGLWEGLWGRPNQYANAPIHHVAGRPRRDKARGTRTHVPSFCDQRGTRSSVDEESPIRVVADPFGDRCSTGERLLLARPYGGVQPHTCRHGMARTWGPARWTHTRVHAGRSRSRRECTRVKTSPGWRAAMCIASRWKRREVLFRGANSDATGRKLVALSSGSVTKRKVILSFLSARFRNREFYMFARKRLDENRFYAAAFTHWSTYESR